MRAKKMVQDRSPDERLLMDCHPPHGLHYHLASDVRVYVNPATLEEALSLFEKKVIEAFGQLKEKL